MGFCLCFRLPRMGARGLSCLVSSACLGRSQRIPTTEENVPSLVCLGNIYATLKETRRNLLTGTARLCYTNLMLLQTWVQLHILLSAAPALAGWTPYLHAVPLAAGQAVYGVCAAPRTVTVSAQNSPHTSVVPAAHGCALPARCVCQAQCLVVPAHAHSPASYLQEPLVSPQSPRAP